MTTSKEFEQKVAERVARAQSERTAKEEADKRAEREEAKRQSKIADAEETWFPAAKSIRDNDFDAALETVRQHLKRGQIRNEDRHRGYWAHLTIDEAEMSVAIIPVPKREIIMLRAVAEHRPRRVRTPIHDETKEFPPASFNGDEPRRWIEDQITDMAVKLIDHGII